MSGPYRLEIRQDQAKWQMIAWDEGFADVLRLSDELVAVRHRVIDETSEELVLLHVPVGPLG